MFFFLNALDEKTQVKITHSISKIIDHSPFFCPRTPRFNKPFNILITNAGKWGWKADAHGYGYIKTHPLTGKSWTNIPKIFFKIWKHYCSNDQLPNSCLINLYNKKSTLGLHQDKDENDFSIPVLSISLGSSALFNYGNNKSTIKNICLTSGSVVLMKDHSRLFYHGISKVYMDKINVLHTTNPKKFGRDCRINLTLRRYTPIH